MHSFLLLAFAALATCQTSATPQFASDSGVYGPAIEAIHAYYDEWPTGIAVSSTGRMFSNYPPALDPTDMNYTVAELTSFNTETPFPSAEYNSPPGGRINYTTTPPTGANYQNHLIGVQSVVIDPADRLWILDTGRVAMNDGTILTASYGGPKLIGVNLTNNEVFQTIVFSPTAAPATSYLNDVRFDLSPNITESGKGVAYISDSSAEGTNAIVIVDLGTGEAWRRLVGHPSVRATNQFVPTIWGQPVYMKPANSTGMPYGNINFGIDGIALSADGCTIYYATTAGDRLYSISTAILRRKDKSAELAAWANVQDHGVKGLSDGLETDTNNMIYGGNMLANEIIMFDPATEIFSPFVRDPRFSWTDTLSVGADGYLYFTENQLWRGATYNGGVDAKVKPYALFRVKLPNNGTKVTQPAP